MAGVQGLGPGGVVQRVSHGCSRGYYEQVPFRHRGMEYFDDAYGVWQVFLSVGFLVGVHIYFGTVGCCACTRAIFLQKYKINLYAVVFSFLFSA